MLTETVSKNLKQLRLARKLSQGGLAEKSGLSVSYISMLERAQRSPPLDTLEQLAKALGTTPVALCGGKAA
jgi:transcriptional regulator with XRE-family HTH domain